MFKKSIVFCFALFLCSPLSADKPDWPGVWTIWGGETLSNADKPWYKGTLLTTAWKDIEPRQGRFDFSDIDQRAATAAKNGLNIAKAFSEYGARMGETEVCTAGAHAWRSEAKALNDVARDVWPGNYRMYLYQYDPNETSQGCWRVGSTDEPYGRFARGFDHRHGKDAMYFDIDDGFFHDKPLAGQYPVKVRVVYFDKGTGSWSLVYDAIGSPQQTADTVKKTDSGTWKEKTVTIADGHFGNRAPHQTDLMLVNADDEDDLFHMIELTRETGDRKGYWGAAQN